jgi:6-phosphofructokinase
MGKGSSMKIGILTAGGDCPGINAAIRGVGKTAIMKYGMKLVGLSDGFTGLINKEYTESGNKFWCITYKCLIYTF